MDSIWGLLPMFFWEGPPLPRMLGVTWSSMTSSSQTPSPSFISNATEVIPQSPTSTYDNEEITEYSDFDPVTFMPHKIVVHRHAKLSK
jgi:hypothetical protein